MAYRNGTYVAFHAEGTSDPTASDMKYYNLLKAWTAKTDDDFSFINSHEKTAAVRDSSLKETLRRRLVERLRNSKHLLLILGVTTKQDTDWVPFEIEYAIDTCKIPLIIAYTTTDSPIYEPARFQSLWPESLRTRIQNQTVGAIHMPFKKAPIADAIGQFGPTAFPKGGSLGFYSTGAYQAFGMF